MSYIEKNLIDFDGNMQLSVDSMIEINNMITGSNNITLTKVNVNPYRFDKIYMDKDVIKDKLYLLMRQKN